jgi:hypothetical protein
MLGLCFAGGAVYGQQHEVFYVDNDAPDGGNGLEWDSAFDDFQEGIDAAIAWVDQDENNTCEIRVAGAVGGVGGVYVPPVSTKRVWHDNRTRSFQMVNRTEMLGGYRGCDSGVCGEPGSGEQGTARG